MNPKIAFAAAAAIAWLGVSHAAGPKADPARIVPHFESHNEAAVSVFVRLGIQAGAPMGVIETDDRLCSAKPEIEASNQPLSALLNSAVSGLSGYRWRVDNGVVLIGPWPYIQNLPAPGYGASPIFHSQNDDAGRGSLARDVRSGDT